MHGIFKLILGRLSRYHVGFHPTYHYERDYFICTVAKRIGRWICILWSVIFSVFGYG